MPSPAFPETADIETSSEGYASRFAGPIGQWLLSVQEQVTFDLLSNEEKGSVLDVGGGHGQLAGPFARKGWDVTVIGSDESCRMRISSLLASGLCKFQSGNLVKLPFPDRSFDHVLCFRFVSHCQDWQMLLRELCRVARKSVIIDYPPLLSWNFLTPLLFNLKKKLEGNTRTYTLFRHREIERIFRQAGFVNISRRGQFFLPMVVHRKLQRPDHSHRLETFFRRLRLTNLLGSPTILRASPSQPFSRLGIEKPHPLTLEESTRERTIH